MRLHSNGLSDLACIDKQFVVVLFGMRLLGFVSGHSVVPKNEPVICAEIACAGCLNLDEDFPNHFHVTLHLVQL